MQVAPVPAFQPMIQRPTGQAEGIGAGGIRGADNVHSTREAATSNPAWQQSTGGERGIGRAQQSRQAGGDTPHITKNESEKAQRGDATPTKPSGEALSEPELAQLDQLKQTDREVRQHEHAHKSTGGQFAGNIEYEYQRGPDGQRYAVAGEVSIDSSPIPGDPAATIAKMEQIRAAANAPAEPSAQDRKVAAQASQHLMAARLELAMQQREMDEARGAANEQPGELQQADTSSVAAAPSIASA